MDMEVVKVIKQYVSSEGVDANYIRNNILPGFFHNLWIRWMALDPNSYRQIVETTVELAKKVGAADIVGRIVEGLKDEDELYRRMVMETVGTVIADLGSSDIDTSLEGLLVDGSLHAFAEQTSDDDNVMLDGLCAVVNSLGRRMKPYIRATCGTIKWCLNSSRAKVRKQAADAISRIVAVLKQCEEERLMGYLGAALFQCCLFGEGNPEVLASTLGALKTILDVIDKTSLIPRHRYLLSRLTPLMESRHENVQDSVAGMGALSFSE